MRPAEVLAVEVVQYLNPNGIRTLVANLLGATERAQSTKAISVAKVPIDEEQCLSTLADKNRAEAGVDAGKMINWMRQNGLEVIISNSQDSLIGTLADLLDGAIWHLITELALVIRDKAADE